MILVGLTGGIASGKSTVSSILRNEFQCPVVDADVIAREVVKPGRRAYKNILRCFGERILLENGEINRAKLGEVIFNDEGKRKKLNSITHPEIGKAMLCSVLKYFFLGHRFIILDVPLLFESKTWIKLTTFNVIVYCEGQTQLDRLMTRNDLSESEAQHRIDCQMPLSEKKDLASFVVDNDGSLENTFVQVQHLYQTLNSSKKYLIVRFIAISLLILTFFIICFVVF